MELGRFERALDFIQFDAGSEWASYATVPLLMRQGKVADARQLVQRMSDTPHYHKDLVKLPTRTALRTGRFGH